MGSISSLSVALSGLRAAQGGLAVTGQNVSNSTVEGYTRQQSIQQDYSYRTIGSSGSGSLKLQAGLGTQISAIRQIRNKFYDITYREEYSSGNYYARLYTAGEEINNILGELESSYTVQEAINGVWNSINELIQDPSAIETRSLFIQNTVTFLDKMSDVYNNLIEYQLNLNEQIKEEVNSINSIIEQIAVLNQQIELVETNGNRANDLRDTRNNLLDELSGYLDVEIKEVVAGGGNSSRIDILFNGNELLVENVQNKIGLQYANSEYPFCVPVFTSSNEILSADANAKKLFQNLSSEDLSSNKEGAKGSLKALLVSRGDSVGNYTSLENTSEINNSLITELQARIDNLVHEIVTLLNNASTSGLDLNGENGVPIFVRIGTDDSNGILADEDSNDYKTLFTLENIRVNSELLKNDGYNKLGFSAFGALGDTSILEDLSAAWKSGLDSLDGYSVDTYYRKIVTDFAVTIKEAEENYNVRVGTIELAENQRLNLSAVSLDEELTNMIKYQHAYNSAAKMLNVIDSMLDRVINGTGKVGL